MSPTKVFCFFDSEMYSTTHVESTGIYRIVLKQTGVLLATANCFYVSLTSVDPNQHNSDNAIALKHHDVIGHIPVYVGT